MLYALFLPIKNLVKHRTVCIDNKVFQLSSIVTSALFLCLAIIYGVKDIVGEPMVCMGDAKSPIPIDVVTSYCWISSTYSVVSYFDPDNLRKSIHPGVGTLGPTDETVYHKYYQWIPFFFLFLSILFYIPRYIWKYLEGGLMKMLRDKLHSPIVETSVKQNQLTLLVNYLHQSWGFHAAYAYGYFACEVANLVIVFLAWVFADLLLSYNFTNYGYDVLSHWRRGGKDVYGRETPSPMNIIFPRVTKCQFATFGPGGGRQPNGYICILAINNWNDKVFFVLWFYFILLAALGVINLMYRISVLLSKRMRSTILRWRIQRCSVKLDDKCISKLVENATDWVVLDQLAKNIDAIAYADLLESFNSIWDPHKSA